MAIPITSLELRRIEIPRSPLIEFMEREIGRELAHEDRHFLAGEPVHCGAILELYENGSWVPGRYEWTCRVDELPTFQMGERVIELNGQELLRWPK